MNNWILITDLIDLMGVDWVKRWAVGRCIYSPSGQSFGNVVGIHIGSFGDLWADTYSWSYPIKTMLVECDITDLLALGDEG